MINRIEMVLIKQGIFSLLKGITEEKKGEISKFLDSFSGAPTECERAEKVLDRLHDQWLS